MTRRTTLHPVILPVPAAARPLKGRPKVDALRAAAREALAQSARYSGQKLGPLDKDDNGAPLPSNGLYWSLTHKNAYVAAVCSPHAVGIDIERLRPVSESLGERLAAPDEWALAPTVDTLLFFRYWTAKEAVLKAVGMGLTGLSRCRIHRIVDDDHLLLTYDGRPWQVTHHRVGQEHLVTITSDRVELIWHLRL
ncbi:4'-phosphopantetheinyl transferase family protein [Desulfatitalea tepidiphila]|uniref:4'-phosphopantetheinyl transferase family protein n=1 Tax=Desulfatitalea tepidiphila TaxID=1185843 RepID=UPI0006B662B5|nr:4'-phosphopantetheinyl transferase superfamily protein [Desulfatitalea tepidiphila]